MLKIDSILESEIISNYNAGELAGIGIGKANKKEYAEEKIKKEKFAIAKNCLQNGMGIQLIAQITGLPKMKQKN